MGRRAPAAEMRHRAGMTVSENHQNARIIPHANGTSPSAATRLNPAIANVEIVMTARLNPASANVENVMIVVGDGMGVTVLKVKPAIICCSDPCFYEHPSSH